MSRQHFSAGSPARDLAIQLAERAEAFCRTYLSNGHRSGGYWIVGDTGNTRGRSLFVRLTGVPHGKARGANGRTRLPASMAIFSISWLKEKDIAALQKHWSRHGASSGNQIWPPRMATPGMFRSSREWIPPQSRDAFGTRVSRCPACWLRPISAFGICLHPILEISGFTRLWSIATTRPERLPSTRRCSQPSGTLQEASEAFSAVGWPPMARRPLLTIPGARWGTSTVMVPGCAMMIQNARPIRS